MPRPHRVGHYAMMTVVCPSACLPLPDPNPGSDLPGGWVGGFNPPNDFLTPESPLI